MGESDRYSDLKKGLQSAGIFLAQKAMLCLACSLLIFLFFGFGIFKIRLYRKQLCAIFI